MAGGNWIRNGIVVLAGLAAAALAQAQDARPARVVLVTIDGLRWEEVFRGAEADLVTDPELRAAYAGNAAALTPFLNSFVQSGALIGNRDAGSCARVANDYWFSYPGYAEMLSGRPNPAIRSNKARPNDDVTVLERLAQRPDFAGQVQVFAEWNAMPAILNTARSGLPVFIPPDYDAAHDPQVIAAVAPALASLPRVLWVALGDTDNRAHEGDYDAYLRAAVAADAMLRDLWAAIEADPRAAGVTTMIVTADHGRGASAGGRWRGHGSGHWRGIVVPGLRHKGSDAIFIAARGPGIGATNAYGGESCATLGQVAPTLLQSVGLLAEAGQPDMAAPLAIFGSR